MKWLTWYVENKTVMTMDNVCAGAGVDPQRMRMIESGEVLPTHAELERIARVIGWGAAPETMLGEVPKGAR